LPWGAIDQSVSPKEKNGVDTEGAAMQIRQLTFTQVGVAVFIVRGDRFLMGKRRGAHGHDTWSVPGGHLEFGETFEEAARREVAEETGLSITNIRFAAITNDLFPVERKHYVTVWMLSDYYAGQAAILEPTKYVDHGWYNFGCLPTPLFSPWNQLQNSQFVKDIKCQIDLVAQTSIKF
jgi:8-oxo-dGTP diphosphatase